MTGLEPHFLIDTVSLVKLSRAQLRSELVSQHSIIMDEINYEFRDSTKVAEVAGLVEGIDADLLRKVAEILVQPVVQSLLDLYDCEGNGDVLLLAKALSEKAKGEMELFPRNWIIVTDDKKLVDAARANGVDILSTDAFIELITAGAQ